MASLIYNSAKLKILQGTIDFDADTFKVALVNSSYVPNQDTHDFFDDITNEVTGTGYTAGGATLAGVALSQDNTNNRGVFDANDTTWPNSTIANATAAILYKSTGTAATSPLIAYIDLGATGSSTGATFQITWSSDGIFYLG